MTHYIDLRILGGLPVTFGCTVQPSDPEVGVNTPYIDDFYITAVNGKVVEKADWLEKRIDSRKGERDRIEQALWDEISARKEDARECF